MFFSNHGGVQWLVVFLGNPGLKYRNTRHNAGFLTADVVEKDCGVRIDRLRFHALTAQAELGGQKVLLMKPQTYMNNSGEAVAPAAKFYKVPPEHILVVSDEIHLQPGRLRIRTKGSAGGHNGLKSIIASLGTDVFPRIRIGVGAPPHPEYARLGARHAARRRSDRRERCGRPRGGGLRGLHPRRGGSRHEPL